MLFQGQVRKKSLDFAGTHFFEVAGETLFHFVREDVFFDPIDIRLLGVAGVMLHADGITKRIQEFFGRLSIFLSSAYCPRGYGGV